MANFELLAHAVDFLERPCALDFKERVMIGRTAANKTIDHMIMQRVESQRPLIFPREMIRACLTDLSITGPKTKPTTNGAGS